MSLIDAVRSRLRRKGSARPQGNPDPAPPSGGGLEEELAHRHEELAARVAELHWDLGGLAYEMAIRDHFRLDLLVRQAAVLQDCDAELAELERMTQSDPGVAGVPPASGSAQRPGRRGSLPGPGLGALLVLVMIGFGALIGLASRGSGTASAHPSRLTLMIAQAASADSYRGASAGTGGATEPPPIPSSAPTPSPDEASTRAVGTEGPSTPVQEPAEVASQGTSQGVEDSVESGEGSAGAGAGSKGSSAGDVFKGGSSKPSTRVPRPAAFKLSSIRHVFLIVLSDEPYALTFGPESSAPYLAHRLEHKGELMVRFYSVAREGLASEIAMISGLGPTPETALDCPTFNPITPATPAAEGQFSGTGCVYPRKALTIGDQLAARGLSWRVYAQGMENAATGATVCRHPTIGASDPTSSASGTEFATFRDPFSYFEGVIDSPSCAKEDVGLTALSSDLESARSTPALSYIAPDLCDDGDPNACSPGAPAGLPAADRFLAQVVPEILASPAYKKNGLLIITTDDAPATGEYADSSSCCGQPRFPGLVDNAPPAPSGEATPTGTTTTAADVPGSSSDLPPAGGGQVGALLLSPFVKPDTIDQEPFNDFSLLRTIEDVFGVSHLGYAGANGVESFNESVFDGGTQGGK